MQGGDFYPDPGEVPPHALQDEAGLALRGFGKFLCAPADVPVGVVLEVAVAHGGETLDEDGGRLVDPRADGVGEEQADARVPAGPFRLGRIGESRRDIECASFDTDIRGRRHRDGGSGPGQAGVLGGRRSFPHLEKISRPSRLAACRGHRW